MLFRFLGYTLTFVFVLLSLLLAFVCLGCDSEPKVKDTSTGKYREILENPSCDPFWCSRKFYHIEKLPSAYQDDLLKQLGNPCRKCVVVVKIKDINSTLFLAYSEYLGRWIGFSNLVKNG